MMYWMAVVLLLPVILQTVHIDGGMCHSSEDDVPSTRNQTFKVGLGRRENP